MTHSSSSLEKINKIAVSKYTSAGLLALLLSACGESHTHSHAINDHAVDLKDAILQNRSADCADYANEYGSSVKDIRKNEHFIAQVSIEVQDRYCTLTSNNIPNHDFNDRNARFATNAKEVSQSFNIKRAPQLSYRVTPLEQSTYNGIMINGVPIDILSAACYSPNARRADRQGNIPIGCRSDAKWLVDPLGPNANMGADAHNAHTQPDGSYHYHGNPNALFDEKPGNNGSPTIGFAADGFPIYGSYFYDETRKQVRKAKSGYRLKSGTRPTRSSTSPGGNYDGTYIQDWEFANTGDLDQCNGMTVNGQYGYYVTDTYPWIVNCFSGTPDPSFRKRMGKNKQPNHKNTQHRFPPKPAY
ncbi:YHYH protein [Marinomonas balearica]|uniref:YHYH protein n=1 Tax=Marinomonas balearica TaxID=491947 RepID=A0A4V3CGJ3_9GAMM|nr:YHYH protein [Marinomonas balearica]TDO97902.1 YHYH protein [Marinomonas balearica]